MKPHSPLGSAPLPLPGPRGPDRGTGGSDPGQVTTRLGVPSPLKLKADTAERVGRETVGYSHALRKRVLLPHAHE